jgi:hypothetical protein
MPFRVPSNYERVPVSDFDPSLGSIRQYVAWLRRELAIAEAALAQITKNPEPKGDKDP